MNTSIYLRSFRLVCNPNCISLVENLLEQQGFRFIPEHFSPFVRRLVHEPFPLGASFAAKFGYIYIQDKSSMLPPVMLAPAQGAAVLDMCASPGSKTGFLGQLVGPNGFVLGNEPSHNRLATLRRNLGHLNLINCATTSYSGEELPLPPNGNGWDYIQLDPPCSGWGTVEKNPQVLSLWQGDKVKPLIAIQRQLLAHAYNLLAPGGRLVYSTCTTNIEENERQLEYACDEIGYLFASLAAPEGVEVEESLIPRFAGCMRIATSQDAQGFFVAALIKPHTATAPNAGALAQALPLAVDPEEKALLDSMRNPFLPGAPGKKGRRSGKNTQAQRTFKNTSWLEAERIGGHSLDGAFASSALLPQGDLALYNDVVHFLPKAAATLLPPTMSWKGFPLGKVGADGAVKIAASLRALMPSLAQAKAQRLPIMEMEDPALLQALLSGQSVTVEKGNSVLGLYYLGLPLCTLTVKGSRAILPNRQ